MIEGEAQSISPALTVHIPQQVTEREYSHRST